MKTFPFLVMAVLCSVQIGAQNYEITFSGEGESTVVDSVTIENMTQLKSITIGGGDILKLVSWEAGVIPLKSDVFSAAVFPNPLKEEGIIEFYVHLTGNVTIQIIDMSGKILNTTSKFLNEGRHSFGINGLQSGSYVARIITPGRQYNVKMVSAGEINSECVLYYSGQTDQGLKKSLKSGNIIYWQYDEGDVLLYKGNSSENETWVRDVPAQSKAIKFEFTRAVDADGNRYPVVRIGKQKWMARNLKTTKYSSGEDIPYISDSLEWVMLRDQGVCWYRNVESSKNKFGGIYTWYVTSWGNPCPVNWHVPSEADWDTLQNYLIKNGYNYDLTTNDNKIAKAMSYNNNQLSYNWLVDLNTGVPGNIDYMGALNKSGFSALPAPTRGTSGFSYIGYNVIWWTSDSDGTFAFYRAIQHNWEDLQRNRTSKWAGLSIRCIRD
jgi:uncharacterized protein (TIGR02145 family)